jgi:hypothetical protein
MNLFDGLAVALRPSAARCDDEGLTEWMGVPGGARSGLEGYGGSGNECWVRCGEERIDANGSGEPLGWAACGSLGADSFDFHVRQSSAVRCNIAH